MRYGGKGPLTYECKPIHGISAGWGDLYGSELDCQWIDITDVPPGPYVLEIAIDEGHLLDELDVTNNTASVQVNLE